MQLLPIRRWSIFGLNVLNNIFEKYAKGRAKCNCRESRCIIVNGRPCTHVTMVDLSDIEFHCGHCAVLTCHHISNANKDS